MKPKKALYSVRDRPIREINGILDGRLKTGQIVQNTNMMTEMQILNKSRGGGCSTKEVADN